MVGLTMYNFFQINLKLPVYKTIRNFINKEYKIIHEGHLRFEELKLFLEKHQYKLEIGVFEDGTRIISNVDYDSTTDTLIGLVAPYDETGMPYRLHFKANCAVGVLNAIRNNNTSSTVQVIIAKPNNTNSIPFVLGVFGTDNKFSNLNVQKRYKFIMQKCQEIGIKVICFGSDGDSRFLMAQKKMINFGWITKIGNSEVAANYRAEIMVSQDPLHAVKRMKNKLYNPVKVMEIGKFIISPTHLILILRKFHRSDHHLCLSDFNILRKMDYK
jgi:hypothetical protein